MTLRGDDRAVTVQVGAVLLFGFLVVSMATYQVAVVPTETKAVEFEHSQTVRADLLNLQSTIHRVAVSGGTHPTPVDLGVRYGSRSFFVNPPPARGRLASASGGATLSVSNAVAVDAEVADYWNDTTRSFRSTTLTYRPEYNEYSGAPTTVLETGVAYDRFGDAGATVVLTNQTLVDGRHLSLMLRTGNVSLGGAGTRSIAPRAVSVATRSIVVEGGDGNVTVRVPTRLNATAWAALLAGEMDQTGTPGNDRYVYAVREGPGDSVVVEMEAGATYDLRIGKAGLGSDVDRPAPRYVTRVTRDLDVTEGSARTVVFEVRDRYDNPVSGARVNVSLVRATLDDPREAVEVVGASGETISDLTTDADGRVAVRYVAPASVHRADTATLTARIVEPEVGTSSDETVATAVFDVGSTAGDTYDLEWDLEAITAQRGVTGCDEATTTCTYDVSEDEDKKVTLVVRSMGASFVVVDFSTNNSTLVTSFTPSSGETGGDGVTSTEGTVDTALTGIVRIFASAVEDSDVLRIRVE